jgi:hypothetical protein
METTMSVEKKFLVDEIRVGYSSDRFEVLKEAEACAREKTYRYGESYGIFELKHATKVPEVLNNIVVETVK